jgi:SET domain-containing protein
LHDYYFQWDGDQAAIALGLGSLYNHSEAPNAEFEMDYDFDQIRFAAILDIAAGQEITTDYRSGKPEMKLWFE